MTYTRVNIQSNHFYEIILKCKRESELSFNDANLMLIADLFDEDYDDNAAEIRVLALSLTENPKVFARAFRARYTGKVSFRLFNKTDIPVEISYVGFHEIKSAKRFFISLKDFKISILTIARYLSIIFLLLAFILYRPKAYKVTSLILSSFCFCVAASIFIFFPHSILLFLNMAALLILITAMGYGISIWLLAKWLKGDTWLIMPIIGISVLAIVSIIICTIMPGKFAVPVSGAILIGFSIFIFIKYNSLCLSLRVKNGTTVVLCSAVALLVGLSPLFTKVDYNTTIGVVCDAIRYSSMARHFMNDGLTKLPAFILDNVILNRPMWSRCSLFPIQTYVSLLSRTPIAQSFTMTAALFYSLIPCGVFLLWKLLLKREINIVAICATALILFNSTMISGIVDDYLSHISSVALMLPFLGLGLLFINKPHYKTALAFSIIASFIAQNYLITIAIMGPGLFVFYAQKWFKRNALRENIKILLLSFGILAFLALTGFKPIVEFIKYCVIMYDTISSDVQHGSLKYAIGIFSIIGIDNHIQYQYNFSVHNLCPLFSDYIRHIIAYSAIIVIITGLFRQQKKYIAFWLSLLATCIIMIIYFYSIRDYYLHMKIISFLIPPIIFLFAVGVDSLQNKKILNRLAWSVMAIILFATMYNFAASLYHNNVSHSVLLDKALLKTVDSAKKTIPENEPFIFVAKGNNRDYWLVEHLSHMKIYYHRRKNTGKLNPSNIQWALVSLDAVPNLSGHWWANSLMYSNVWQNSRYAIRHRSKLQKPHVVFRDDFNHPSTIKWKNSQPENYKSGKYFLQRGSNKYDSITYNISGLLPHSFYKIKIILSKLSNDNSGLVICDLFGPKYDSPRQEMKILARKIPKKNKIFTKIINTENIPSKVLFRIISYSPSKIYIDSIELIGLPEHIPEKKVGITINTP